MKTYSEKLRDPRWQKMRLKVMERDGFTCQFCDAKDKTLNVHHKFYQKGRDPWEYSDYMMVTCCETCRGRVEDLKKLCGAFIRNKGTYNDMLRFIMGHDGNHELIANNVYRLPEDTV